MNAFGNEREEHLMRQHPLLRKPSHFLLIMAIKKPQRMIRTSGAGLTFFRRWNYGLSLRRQRTKYPEFRGA